MAQKNIEMVNGREFLKVLAATGGLLTLVVMLFALSCHRVPVKPNPRRVQIGAEQVLKGTDAQALNLARQAEARRQS